MSLFTIETCFVPAAALPDAAGEPAALAIALAAAPPLLASGCELQAAATSAMTANSADTARDHRPRSDGLHRDGPPPRSDQ